VLISIPQSLIRRWPVGLAVLLSVALGALACGPASSPALQPTVGPTALPLAETPQVNTVAPPSLPPVGAKVGERAPNFALQLTDGSTVTGEGLTAQGKPTFLFFAATW